MSLIRQQAKMQCHLPVIGFVRLFGISYQSSNFIDFDLSDANNRLLDL